MSKKFLTKVVLATVLASGINLLPTPNFDAGNVQISVAYAESKNFAAKEAAMTDVEIIEAQAKEASRLRAIEAVKEKIASYVRNFSGAKGKLNEDDIAAIAEKFEEVGEVKYKKLFYNAVDEEGKELGKVGIMYEATVTAKFNSKKITEYIKLTEQEKAKRIRQAREAREHFEELDREYEELRKNARTKTPEQLQSDIKIFDDKISDLEKRRGKNKSAKKDKPTTQQNKIQPMRFSNPVTIGEFGASERAMGIYIHGASNVNEQPRYVNDHGEIYSKGIARFGDGNDALYLHYDFHSNPCKIGGNDIKNTIAYNEWYGAKIFKVSATNGYTMYFIKASYLSGTNTLYEHYILIGRRPDGKWVKYFNTEDLCKQYMGKSENVSIQKITANGNTITANYARCNNLGRNEGTFYAPKADEFGEFRFKWDEAAKWFSVEKVDSQNKPAPQKPTQENKPVTNQPMQFSQPVKVGSIGHGTQSPFFGLPIEGATYNDGTLEPRDLDVKSLRKRGIYSVDGKGVNTYVKGTARFSEGDNALYCSYGNDSDAFLKFGGKNNYILSTNAQLKFIYRIDSNNLLTIYVLYHNYCVSHVQIIGKQKDGKWVSFIDSKKVSDMYFNGKDAYKLEGGVIYEKPKCQGDTIIIPYRRWDWNTTPGLEGEIRLKWDEKAQWFGIEKVVY